MNRRDEKKATARRLLAALALICLAAAPLAASGHEVAKMEVGKEKIVWHPVVEYESMTLTVSGRGVHMARTFPAGKAPGVGIESKHGRLADGTYAYELRLTPPIDPKIRERLAAAREAMDRGVEVERRELQVSVEGPTVQSGHFTVREGAFVSPREPEPEEREKQTGAVRISGDLEAAGRKSFVMPDPSGRGRLVYTALEGPEAGTYHRGSARTVGGEAVIELPAHFAAATEAAGLTVQLTPIGAWGDLYVAEKSRERLVIRSAGGADVEFDYFVQGVRRGYADFQVERLRSPTDKDEGIEER